MGSWRRWALYGPRERWMVPESWRSMRGSSLRISSPARLSLSTEACHTVVEVLAGGFTVNSVGTTLSRTMAAHYTEGSPVNLERALAVGTRLDGHFVHGHVDAVGDLIGVEDKGEYRLLDFKNPVRCGIGDDPSWIDHPQWCELYGQRDLGRQHLSGRRGPLHMGAYQPPNA